jgi:outer membrane lipoprotein-sorting protein
MRRLIILMAIATGISFLISSGETQTLTGAEILKKVDENQYSSSKIAVSRMIIHGRRGSRNIDAKTSIRGVDTSFTEYLAPVREKGTKMLKLGDKLWMYSPTTDRTIMISGHMLRQSVMGSDLSYEDMMEDHRLENLYDAKVSGEDTLDDRSCWILDLTAKEEDIAYFSRKIWVDKERFIMLKENRYAKSGKLLKTTRIREVERMDHRWVAKSVLFKDVLKQGEGTEFILDSIQFDVPIPDYLFSKAALRK